MLVIKKERQGKNIERKLLLKSVTVISSETPMEMWVSMSVSAKTATSPSLGDDSILKAMNANCPQPVYMDRQRNMAMLSLAILVARLSLYSRWSRTVKPPLTTAKRKKKNKTGTGERDTHKTWRCSLSCVLMTTNFPLWTPSTGFLFLSNNLHFTIYILLEL